MTNNADGRTDGSLTPIDPTTGQPGRPIAVDDPYNMYFTPDGRSAVVVAEAFKRLDFRDPQTMARQGSLAVPGCAGINHADFSIDGPYAIVTCEFQGRLAKIDIARRTVVGYLKLSRGGTPRTCGCRPAGRIFFVADMRAEGVFLIDGDALTGQGPSHSGRHGAGRDGRAVRRSSIVADPRRVKENGMTRRDGSTRGARRLTALVVTLLGFGAGVGLHTGYAQVPTAGWLRALPGDKQTDAIDRQLRGFDVAMMEVNYRYTEMYFGAMEGNWDYALYTGEKIGWALENGFERRPKRRANGEAIFLKGPYPPVLDAIKKKDLALFKQRFDSLRAACNACHAAEAVPFIKVGIPTIKQTPLVNN